MNKENILKVFKDIQSGISKHSPEILVGIGIAGMLTTTVLAVKATPKALQAIDEAKKCEETCEKLPVKTVVKVTWKYYVPAAVTCVVSTACLIGASSVSLKRNAALATAYSLSKTALTEYKEQVVETIGEKKEKVIRDNIAKKKVENDPISKKEVIVTSSGKTLCYDSTGGRYFESDLEKIKSIVNELNRRMTVENYISLNEFYSELGLRNTDLGDVLGWNMDDGFIELAYSAQISEDGRPCIVISFDVAPRYDYQRLM